MRIEAMTSHSRTGGERANKIKRFDVSRNGQVPYDFDSYIGEACLKDARKVFDALYRKGIHLTFLRQPGRLSNSRGKMSCLFWREPPALSKKKIKIMLAQFFVFTRALNGVTFMSDEKDILFLNNVPLPQTTTSVKLALRSREGIRGEDTDDEEDDDNFEAGLLEGHITLDPASMLVFSIAVYTDPALDKTPFALTPDRSLWDLYLVIIPFTLHPLQENKYYKQVKFTISLASQEIRAFDLFPRNILTTLEGSKGYTLSVHGRFQEIDNDQLNIGKQLRFAPLQPKISAFGEGEHKFYWIYEGVGEKREVDAEGKYVLAVLRVPRGTTLVKGDIHCRAKLQMDVFGDKNVSTSRIKKYPFRLDLQNAPIFHPTRKMHRAEAVPVATSHFDVCLVCALPEEASALKDVLEHQYHAQVHLGTSSDPRREYYHTSLLNDEGETLSIQVSWLPGYGPDETSLHVAKTLKKFRPRFVGMTGICAGDGRAVALGDLVLATQAFNYEAGKTKLDQQGRVLFEPEIRQERPGSQVIQAAIMFDGWKLIAPEIKRPISKRQQRDWLLNTLHTRNCRIKDIAPDELERHAPLWKELFNELRVQPQAYLNPDGSLKATEEPHFLTEANFPYTDPPHSIVHSGSVASGYKVRADKPFDRIRHAVRSAIAVDMEGSAFYHAMDEEHVPCLFVKGVSDYADTEKDDTFHEYAAEISAIYMVSFIKYFVTSQRVPEQKKLE